jgi:hypothetical protein
MSPLADQIVDLIAFEKNADLITISDMADAPAVVAAYAVLDGTEWINGTADHADVGAAIPANTDFEFADDAATQKPRCLKLLVI